MSSDYKSESLSKRDDEPEISSAQETDIGQTGRQSMQGIKPLPEQSNPAQKGCDFEKWAGENVFHNEARRLTILPEDNLHLDEYGDGVGITKNRRISDAYLDQDGALWELKSGYAKGGIDRDQLYEYSLMEDAGYVLVRNGEQLEDVEVKSVNYLFETKAGAAANAVHLRGFATPWYKDEQGNIQLIEEQSSEE
jgi:hypothetical protein